MFQYSIGIDWQTRKRKKLWVSAGCKIRQNPARQARGRKSPQVVFETLGVSLVDLSGCQILRCIVLRE